MRMMTRGPFVVVNAIIKVQELHNKVVGCTLKVHKGNVYVDMWRINGRKVLVGHREFLEGKT